jgi:hypothetical protein
LEDARCIKNSEGIESAGRKIKFAANVKQSSRMLKIKYLMGLVVLAGLISCQQKKETGPVTIGINEAHFANVPLEKVLSGSEFVPLELTRESALSEFAMFLNWTSGYYLMDQYKSKTVFQFDKKGGFIRTIGKAGQGPGEFTNLGEALVTKNGVKILSGLTDTKIIGYDNKGQYLRTDQILARNSNSFAMNPKSGDYYFFVTGYQHLIQRVDGKSLQPADSFLIRNTRLTTAGVLTFSTTSQGAVLFYQPFDNRIFRLEKNMINLAYRFDVGPSTPLYDDMDADLQTKMVTQRELWFIYKALENSEWLYLLVAQQIAMDENESQFYSLLYQKKTGKIYQLPDTPDPGPLFRPAFSLGDDNILYTSVQPKIINQSAEWKAEFKKRGITLTPDGNYVVVKIPLGKLVQ